MNLGGYLRVPHGEYGLMLRVVDCVFGTFERGMIYILV